MKCSNSIAYSKRLEGGKLVDHVGTNLQNLSESSYYNQISDENRLKYDSLTLLANPGRVEQAVDVNGAFWTVNRSSFINDLSAPNPYLINTSLNDMALINNDYATSHFAKLPHGSMFTGEGISSLCNNAKNASYYPHTADAHGLSYESYCKDSLKYSKVPTESYESQPTHHALEAPFYVEHANHVMEKQMTYETDPIYALRSNCPGYSNMANSLLSPNTLATDYSTSQYPVKTENRSYDEVGYGIKSSEVAYKHNDIGSSSYSNQLKQLTNCSAKLPGYSSPAEISQYQTNEKHTNATEREAKSMAFDSDQSLSRLQQISANIYSSNILENNSLQYETACLLQKKHSSPIDATSRVQRGFCSPLSGSDRSSQISSDERNSLPTEVNFKQFSSNHGSTTQDDASMSEDQSALIVDKIQETASSSDAPLDFHQLQTEENLLRSNDKRNDFLEATTN